MTREPYPWARSAATSLSRINVRANAILATNVSGVNSKVSNCGLMGAVELESRPGAVGARAYDVHVNAFADEGLMVRFTGDIIAMSPPLIVSKSQIDQIVERLRRVLTKVA